MEKSLSRHIGMPATWQVKKVNLSEYPIARTAYLLTARAAMVAKIHGGAQSSKVTVGEYPSVAVSVGKKALNDSDTTKLARASANQ
jgi:cytochrome oxidase assembly protein ShyY1